MFVVSGARSARLVEVFARLGEHADVLGQRPAADHALLLLDAEPVVVGSDREHLREAMTRSRRHRALIALDLGPVEWIRALGASRAAYVMATLQPDILFATQESAAEVGAPLEGIASVPVLVGPEACVVHGSRLAVPSGVDLDYDALLVTFCVALVDGAAPVEALGRAVLVAAMRPVA